MKMVSAYLLMQMHRFIVQNACNTIPLNYIKKTNHQLWFSIAI